MAIPPPFDEGGEGDEHEVGSVFNDRDGCSGHSDLFRQFSFL